MFYREILRSSWSLTRRYPFLWFFGLFAALANNAGEYDILYQNVNFLSRLQTNLIALKEYASDGTVSRVVGNLGSLLANDFLNFLLILVAIFVIVAAVVWLIVVSQNALIAAAAAEATNKGRRTFLDGLWVSSRLFAPVFKLNVLAYLVVYGPLIALGALPAWLYVDQGGTGALFFLSVLAFLLLIPVNVIVSFLVKFATAAVVVKNASVNDALRSSVKLFAGNWLVMLEMAVIVFLINTAILFIVGSVLTVLGLPFSGVLGFVMFNVFLALTSAMLSTFQYSAWTMLYLKLDAGRATAKLVRWFGTGPNFAVTGKSIRS